MTRYLNFSEDFTEKILSGEKRATLRLGIKDYEPGEVVIIRAGAREIGRAVIREVRIKRLEEISDEDVRMDGFDDIDALISALEKFYGEVRKDDLFTQIIFELM